MLIGVLIRLFVVPVSSLPGVAIVVSRPISTTVVFDFFSSPPSAISATAAPPSTATIATIQPHAGKPDRFSDTGGAGSVSALIGVLHAGPFGCDGGGADEGGGGGGGGGGSELTAPR